ncbi:MAG: M23 family metallopeptidase [Planctomycetes bacterium]|nr:M23 family metallopeptidase [Planctomycetota bacterium]
MSRTRSWKSAGARRRGAFAAAGLALLVIAVGSAATRVEEPRAPKRTVFELPCTGYAKAVNARGSFGHHVTSPGSPFHDSWHLGEDVWLPAGTEVRAVADGIVRYSAFSPTWTDAQGFVHWNLGNVIVIEHALAVEEQAEGAPPRPAGPGTKSTREPGDVRTPRPDTSGAAADNALAKLDELTAVCSVYVHLASDRRVKVGDTVKRGAVIGRIGADRSEENGRYPAHLHFGLHRGPYLQIPPSLVRELRTAASSKTGLVLGPIVLRGELVLERSGESNVLITAKESGTKAVLSLLAGSTAPKDPPPDIAGWCQGYGDEPTVEEWLRPSQFVREHGR